MDLFRNKRSHFPLLLNPPIVGAGSRPSLLISKNLAKPAPNAIANTQRNRVSN
ncbi:MAG: hypothetical protein RSE13_03860 [Planktothrix sp. GU0601_MAG3]|nr:MAG: hypothetical protein RSE13_03860 [Planktothrix sp. GU0601_MAG3]